MRKVTVQFMVGTFKGKPFVISKSFSMPVLYTDEAIAKDALVWFMNEFKGKYQVSRIIIERD